MKSINLNTNNNLMFLNTKESVVFRPSDFKYEVEPWNDFNSKDDTYGNVITYNNSRFYSLSIINLNISKDELTDTIYSSLIHDDKLKFRVFSNRYVVKNEDA